MRRDVDVPLEEGSDRLRDRRVSLEPRYAGRFHLNIDDAPLNQSLAQDPLCDGRTTDVAGTDDEDPDHGGESNQWTRPGLLPAPSGWPRRRSDPLGRPSGRVRSSPRPSTDAGL